MSIEHFPIKEKLATNLDSQVAWLAREMGYSRDKTKGYEEKLVRLSRSPEDNQSVYGFMSGYWFRFNKADSDLKELPRQLMVDRALQANAKVVAGLADKIAFALWLKAKAEATPVDSEWLLDTALDSVKQRVEELNGQQTDEELLSLVGKPFEENSMGVAILKLHESYANNANDIDSVHNIALEGAATGVLMWQAYGRSLEQQGYSVEMPMPGESSGIIEPWV